MKRCIVNYITLNAWHPFGQRRLADSLRRMEFTGDILAFNPTSLDCPRHYQIPYAFKLFAMKEAQNRGYKVIIWLDASFWAIHPIDDLFGLIQSDGIVVQDSGYPLGQWSSDISLQHFGINRDAAFDMPMFAGGLIGVDLTKPAIASFFEEFYQQAKEGTCFQGDWHNGKQQVSKDARVIGHRHDMVVGSILMGKYGLRMQSNNTLFSYYAWYEKYKSIMDLSGVYFVCEGGERQI